MDKVDKKIILIGIALMIIGIDFMMIGKDFKKLETQINEIKFEQSYVEYVKEDGERQ